MSDHLFPYLVDARSLQFLQTHPLYSLTRKYSGRPIRETWRFGEDVFHPRSRVREGDGDAGMALCRRKYPDSICLSSFQKKSADRPSRSRIGQFSTCGLVPLTSPSYPTSRQPVTGHESRQPGSTAPWKSPLTDRLSYKDTTSALKQLGVDITNLPPRVRADIEAQHEGMDPMQRFRVEQGYWNPVSLYKDIAGALKQLGIDIAHFPPRIRADVEAQREGMSPMQRFQAEQDYWNPVSKFRG
jgi:hypothetical protein